MQNEFARHGIQSVQRFPALDAQALKTPAGWIHSPGAYGCLLSHIEVVKEARQSGAPNVLIFEDDTVFDLELQNKFAEFIDEVPADWDMLFFGAPNVLIFEDDAVFDPGLQKKFAEFIDEVPTDWDMLFFGALHKDEPIKVAPHVGRITKANSTFAYALNSTVFDEFIDLNRRAKDVLDMNSYVLQERFNCYCFMPNLAWVETEYSDVQNRLERHWYLEKSLVLFGAQVDRLLSKTTIVIAHNANQGSKNLKFLKRYYEEYFSPLIEIVTVEQDAASFHREWCFNTGIVQSDPERTFVILSDSDLYLETLDIRANLRVCEEYDGATGFAEVIELTHDQARHLRETGITRGIDITKNPSSRNTSARFLNRRVLEASGGWREGSSFPAARLFQSPNHALRLPCD